MKILIIAPDFKPNLGGIAQVAWNLSEHMHKKGHEVVVVAGPKSEKKIESNFKIYQVPMDIRLPKKSVIGDVITWYSFFRKTKKTILAIIEEFNPDICFLTSYSRVPGLLLRKLNKRMGVFLHGEGITMLTKSPNFVKRILFKKFVERVNFIFTNSEYSRKELLKLSPRAHSIAIAVGCGTDMLSDVNGKSIQQIRQELKWDDGPHIVTICRLHERKGLDTVIEAMKIVLRKYPQAKYVVAGTGNYIDRLKERADKIGVSGNVVFEGRVSEKRKKLLLKASDIFVMVSRPGNAGEVEGFGISFLEANAMGLPVVGSRCGGITEAVKHGVNGILVEPNNPKQTAEAIIKLLDNPWLRRQYSDAGIARIKTKYNWSSICDTILKRMATNEPS